MRTWMWIALASVLALPLVALIVGSFMPREHVASLTITLAAPPERVWPLVTDFANTPTWRSDITRVQMDHAVPGLIRFTESSSQGDVPFEVVTQDPPRRQVVRVMDADQPFAGTWTWELQPAGSGTILTITEEGRIKNPIFRAVGALFYSPTTTIDRYERALAKALGEQAEPKAR